MATRNSKNEIITFKVDEALRDALKGIPNRSDFIRRALVTALENTCPLCRGTGVLTPQQQEHWQSFAEHHAIVECDDCHESHLVCRRPSTKNSSARRTRAAG